MSEKEREFEFERDERERDETASSIGAMVRNYGGAS